MTSCTCPEMHFDSVFSKILFIACHIIFGDNFCLNYTNHNTGFSITLFCNMHCALSKPVSFLISMTSTFTVFFASFAFMVAKVNRSSGSWSCLVVHDLIRPPSYR